MSTVPWQFRTSFPTAAGKPCGANTDDVAVTNKQNYHIHTYARSANRSQHFFVSKQYLILQVYFNEGGSTKLRQKVTLPIKQVVQRRLLLFLYRNSLFEGKQTCPSDTPTFTYPQKNNNVCNLHQCNYLNTGVTVRLKITCS